jgi:hypothetical protein
MSKSIAKLEQEDYETDDSLTIPPNEIVTYNELRSCADLARMKRTKILDIKPDFQRDVVWRPAQQARFIDSLVKQLPIPSMCFAYDFKAQKWIVIDGLQRLSTIISFLEGADWVLSRLDDIDPALRGKSAAYFKNSTGEDRRFYTQVENLSLPINVLRCDFSRSDHMNYLFTIFHRLNAGGVKLNNQEIRNCIYSGKFNQLLKELDQYSSWRSINRIGTAKSRRKAAAPTTNRFATQELLLRILAFSDERENYTGSMARFLNDFMLKHREGDTNWIDSRRASIKSASDLIWVRILGEAQESKRPNTVLEGLFIGVVANLQHLTQIDDAVLKRYWIKFSEHPAFLEKSLAEGLSKKPKVLERLEAAIGIFSGR